MFALGEEGITEGNPLYPCTPVPVSPTTRRSRYPSLLPLSPPPPPSRASPGASRSNAFVGTGYRV